MIKGLFDGKRWAALWKAVPDYYVPDPEDFRSRSSDRSYSGGDLWNLFHNEI